MQYRVVILTYSYYKKWVAIRRGKEKIEIFK
jgi:hypothetical protein